MSDSQKFDRCFDWLMANEGRYSNDPADPGGETMWGITKAVARQCGYAGEMRQMPLEVARRIYHALYWQDWMCNAEMPLCFELFDAAVNVGPATAAKLLQRALGVQVDGIIGPKTMAAASAMSTVRLWALYSATMLEYRASLPHWSRFGRGWSNRIAANLRRGAALL